MSGFPKCVLRNFLNKNLCEIKSLQFYTKISDEIKETSRKDIDAENYLEILFRTQWEIRVKFKNKF